MIKLYCGMCLILSPMVLMESAESFEDLIVSLLLKFSVLKVFCYKGLTAWRNIYLSQAPVLFLPLFFLPPV